MKSRPCSKRCSSGRVNYWTGEQGREFEQEFAAWCGTRHAVAVANGTVALELAWRSLGIGPEDDVVVTSCTFVAFASCIAVCGAQPVFADVDRNSQNVTAEKIESVLTPATRAIIAVHLAGWPCHMRPILELAWKHNILVVELRPGAGRNIQWSARRLLWRPRSLLVLSGQNHDHA